MSRFFDTQPYINFQNRQAFPGSQVFISLKRFST